MSAATILIAGKNGKVTVAGTDAFWREDACFEITGPKGASIKLDKSQARLIAMFIRSMTGGRL